MTFSLLIFSFAFLVLSAYRLKYSIYLIAVCLPAYLIRFSVFGLPLTLLEIMILITFGVWLIRLIINQRLHTIILPWKWVILLFLLSATVAIIVSPDTRAALGLWRAYFIEPLLLYSVIVNILKSSNERRWLIYSLGLSVIGISLYALGQYFGLFSSPEPWISESPKRVTSVFQYPNAVGLLLTPIIALYLGFLTQKNHRYNHLFSLAVILTGISAILFSFSRGAFVGLAVAFVFLGFFSQRKKWVWLILIIAIGASLLIPASRNQIKSVINVSDVSTDVRMVLWQGTWNLIKAHPIFGAGLAGFPEMYDKYRLIKHTELVLYPHNIFLNFWVEIGLAGFVAVLILFGVFYYSGFSNKKGNISSVLSISLLSAMTALIVYGLVEAPYFKNDLAAQFWILFSLMALTKLAEQRNSSSLMHDDIERLKRHTIK